MLHLRPEVPGRILQGELRDDGVDLSKDVEVGRNGEDTRVVCREIYAGGL